MAKKRRAKTPRRSVDGALAKKNDDGKDRQSIAPDPHQKPNLVRRLGGHLGRTLELGFYYACAWGVDHGGLKLLRLSVRGLVAKYSWAGLALDYTEIALSLIAALVFFIHAAIEAFRNITRSGP
jgi:hypothetical protein